MLSVAIVDDLKGNANTLKGYVERYQRENDVSLSVKVFYSGLDFLDEYGDGFDIVFLDIDMPHYSGMQVAHKIRETDKLACIFFITNLAQYAIEGYSVNAMDYILKPIDYAGFSLKLTQAIKYQERYAEKFYNIVNTDQGFVRIKLSDILYIESRGHYIYIHKDKDTYKQLKSLKDLSLPGFAKCHTSLYVNMEHIKSMNGNELLLTDGETLLISRGKKQSFVDDFTKFLGGNI